MGRWEPNLGQSDEWYTPPHIFEALGETFDLDVAHPPQATHVPCRSFFSTDGLTRPWHGFVWMNPPFGGRNGLAPWLDRFFDHGSGIALTPDRTSAPWWQEAAGRCDAFLFTAGKIRFLRPDGSEGVAPSNGTTLWAAGKRAVAALTRASVKGLGLLCRRISQDNTP